MPGRTAAEVKTVLLFSFESLRARDLANFVPDALDHFGIALQVFIGEPGSDLTDSFDFVVCSRPGSRNVRRAARAGRCS